MKKTLLILLILFITFLFILLNLKTKVILFFAFIFILGLMWKLFLRGREIERELPIEINSQKVNTEKIKAEKDHFKEEEIFRKLTYFDRTAFGFYRVMCKNFLYLDKKYGEKEILPEKPKKKLIQDGIKENEFSEIEKKEPEGSHYLLDELPNILKEALDEKESLTEEPLKSIKREKYEELIEKERGEEAETELDIVLRRVKKRMNRVTREIISSEKLDLEGIIRCEKVFASIMHLRNGEEVKGGIVKVPENDCVVALISILKWLWVDNSFKDFLKTDDLKQAVSESKFYVLNEAIILYLFWYFFFEKPDTILKYEIMEEGQEEILKIYHQVNICIKNIYEQTPYIFSSEKIDDIADELRKIQGFSFPKDFRPFLRIILTPEERTKFFEYRNHLWKKSVLTKARKIRRNAEVKIEKYKAKKIQVLKKLPKKYLELQIIEGELENAEKQLEEVKQIIQRISLKKIKNDFVTLSESGKNLDNLLCELRKDN